MMAVMAMHAHRLTICNFSPAAGVNKGDSMKRVTLSYLKHNAATLDVSDPLIVTQNGQPAYVVESYDDRVRRDERIALLILMTLSEQDREQGRTFSREQLLDSL
jgi:hypothetical protein